MLPKLSQIYDRRRVVFILATNHINQFDFAISRLGRFDIVVQVLQPTVAAKFGNWNSLRDYLETLGTDIEALKSDLSVLAFKEFEAMVPKLMKAESAQQAAQIVEESAKKCIFRQKPFGGEETWEQKAATEGENQNRI
jgi:SpoVK/Ycf46/Vps4 family AAA+-type ATPase